MVNTWCLYWFLLRFLRGFGALQSKNCSSRSIRKCFLWTVLPGDTNYYLIKPSDKLMMNSVFQIKSWISWNDKCFFGKVKRGIWTTQATLKWKLMDNTKANFKYAFLNFSIFPCQKLTLFHVPSWVVKWDHGTTRSYITSKDLASFVWLFIKSI